MFSYERSCIDTWQQWWTKKRCWLVRTTVTSASLPHCIIPRFQTQPGKKISKSYDTNNQDKMMFTNQLLSSKYKSTPATLSTLLCLEFCIYYVITESWQHYRNIAVNSSHLSALHLTNNLIKLFMTNFDTLHSIWYVNKVFNDFYHWHNNSRLSKGS